MATPVLATKLFIPPPRPRAVLRRDLIERLNGGRQGRFTLVSAPAGFGKTTLISEWVAACEGVAPTVRVAWLSLDEGDSDPARFLTYLIAALQTVAAHTGEGVLAVLQSPQPPPIDSMLTPLLNEIAAIPCEFVLVLDDYHVIGARPAGAPTSVDDVVAFLVEHSPPPMHLVIATREDPHLPLARLRARGQLTELRAAELRFSPAEAAEFLNQVMGLALSTDNVAALETRTEGWIAGLQLAAISMRGHHDTTAFINSFTGSHRFVLDYLVEEVLHQQTARVLTFLLRTSILTRLCGPLCDAVLRGERDSIAAVSGQETLEYLEHANLFIVPLDDERHWYRYHHLFAELLRQRLQNSENAAEYHIRASQWYEDNGLEMEAFQHAAAANDVERATRVIESEGMPLHLHSVATTVLNWLRSLPVSVLNSRPELWRNQASLLLGMGETAGVEEVLRAAEAALAAAAVPGAEPDDKTRNLIGQIAVARAGPALTQHQPEIILFQTRRAMEYLNPNNLVDRSDAMQAMGYAHYLKGDRVAAGRAYAEALSMAQASGNITNTILATTLLAQIQHLENQLHLAADTYQRVRQLVEDYSPSSAGVVTFGLARICYEWNDLESAERYGELTLQLARQYYQFVNRFIMGGVFLVSLKLAQGNAAGAVAMLAEVEQSMRQHNFMQRMPEVAGAQVLVLLRQGDLAAAGQIAQAQNLPGSLARVLLAQCEPSKALAVLQPLRCQMEARGWQDQRLKTMVLEAVAWHLAGGQDEAMHLLNEALALAEPGGFIRLFVDEGEPMRFLIAEYQSRAEKQSSDRVPPHRSYVATLLAAFGQPQVVPESPTPSAAANPRPALVEPLTQRELEILRLIAQGLSNQEIGARMFLALNTVKGHNRVIFEKLQVQNRTEAVARGRELGLL